MRYAVFSDVHAYPQALEKVLSDAESQNVDSRICLGDVVGYGPDPVGAVKLCREACDTVIAGNHDAAVTRQISTVFFIPRAQKAVARHRKMLDGKDIEWLSSLPMCMLKDGFAAAHGEFHRHWREAEAGFGYVISESDAKRTLDALPPDVQLVFVGHTHAACVWCMDGDKVRFMAPADFSVKAGARYVVNVGAVGYPRHHLETNYVIYDSEAHTVAFRHIPFDFDDYCRRLDEAGIDYPLWLTDYLHKTGEA